MTNVILSEEEARQFILFQKHRRLFEILDSVKILGKPNSNFQVHYDSQGKVRVLDLHERIQL